MQSYNKRILLSIGLMFCFLITAGQKLRDLGMKPTWYKGSIQLKGEDLVEGYLYYNTNFGTVQYKTTEEDEMLSFQENRVQSMQFFDPKLNRTRSYQTITHVDTLTDKVHETLFEVVKDFKNFAVLSRMSRASMLFPSNYNPYALEILEDFGIAKDQLFIQLEGIFFVDKKDKLALYLLIKDMDYDGLIYDYQRSKSKIIKPKILENYSGKYWDELETYIKENKLKTKSKADLLRILDHYEHLVVAKG